MLKKITRASKNRPKTVIIIVLLISIGMVYGASQITMSTEAESFLPEDYTSVKVTNILENKGSASISEIVLVEGDNLNSAESFKTLVQFQSALIEEKSFDNYIKKVQSYPSYITSILQSQVGNWQDLPNQQLETIISQILSRPEVAEQVNSFLSENKDATILVISLNGQLPHSSLVDNTEELHEFVENFAESKEKLSFGVTGTVSMEVDTRGMMNRDNQVLVPAAIILVIVILYLAFRRFSDTLLPFLVLGIGALWMIGTMGFLGIPFNMIYVALVPIILGIGIDYTIHMLNRYYEEISNGLSVENSAVTAVENVGVAISLTAVTTMIGFISFGVADMPPIRDFGFLAATGVFFIFLLSMTLLPSLLVHRDRGEEETESKKIDLRADSIGKALSKLERGVFSHGKTILTIAGVVTALAIVPALEVTTTMSFDMFLPSGVDSVETMEDIEHYFGGQGSFSEDYVLLQGDVTSPQSLQMMHQLENSIVSDPRSKDLIVRSSSLTDLILYYTGGSIPKTPQEISSVIEELRRNRPDQLKRFLIDEEKALVRFSMSAQSDKDMDKATEIIREHVGKFADQQEVLEATLDGDPAVGGAPAIIADIMDSIKPSMRNSIILAVLMVIIVLSVVFRSFWIGILGSIPVLIALIWELGALGGIGWPLDVMNMMVSALAIGIGVDFSIHITHRFQEEWRSNNKTPEEAMSITIRSVGRALTAAAATTIGVFLVLSLSNMPPITRFGQISALVIFFSLVGALLVLPAALLAYARWKKED